jgi:hypothetical protein
MLPILEIQMTIQWEQIPKSPCNSNWNLIKTTNCHLATQALREATEIPTCTKKDSCRASQHNCYDFQGRWERCNAFQGRYAAVKKGNGIM